VAARRRLRGARVPLTRGVAALLVAAALAACAGGDTAAPPTATTTTTAPPAYPASIDARPSAGCGDSAIGPVRRERRTLEIAGEERWYLLSTPTAHDGETPLPLVLELHGLAQGAEGAANTGLLDDLGEREGFVSAFPHGTGAPVRWNERLDDPANADLDFIGAVLDDVGEARCIDEARVYVGGLSYGAIMSSTLACTMADRFAAIGPVAGVRHPEGCEPSRPVPVLSMHGTVDPILLFNGGIGDLGAALSGGEVRIPDGDVDLDGEGYPAAMREWAEANGCGTSTDERRSEHVIDRSWDCPDEVEVRFLIIEGGGHSWPGSAAHEALERIVGPTTDELDATAELWAFYRRHARSSRG